jgi:sarcosine oxidase subunit alpha
VIAVGGARLSREMHGFEWIDRARPITLRFNGKVVHGLRGDSIGSALWANGQRVFGHSPRKRRPRGFDAGMLVADTTLGTFPVDETAATDGMDLHFLHQRDAEPAPAWVAAGSKLGQGRYYDVARAGDARHERAVRERVGVTNLPVLRRRDVAKRHASGDVLVVGGGLAGLAAAVTACARARTVMLVESAPTLGGRAVATREGRDALVQLLERAAGCAGLRVLTNATALGFYDDRFVPISTPEGVLKFRARAVVLATGRLDLPAVFRNNDLPGVMTLAAAERLSFRYGVRAGTRVVVYATRSADAERTARDVAASGAEVAAIVKAPGERIEEAIAGGDGSLAAVIIDGSVRRRVDCDALIVSGGSAPEDALVLAARGTHLATFVPVGGVVAENVWAAGSVVRACSAEECLHDGERIGATATGATTSTTTASAAEEPLLDVAPIVDHPDGACFVDLDEDVELRDLDVAFAEGFTVSPLLSAYTKFGRGISQSKASHAHAARVLSEKVAAPLSSVGRPLPRPPTRPVAMQLLAGRGTHPRRRTPLHDWHASNGAEFLLADDWERPAVYLRSGNRAENIAAEVLAVRGAVGIIDVGTLGKLEIVGADAGEFLDQVYTGRFADMAVGTCRYALLCDESGAIVDDGVAARFAPDRFYVTTTTTASGAVYREMSRWALELGKEVVLTNLTGAVAAFNVAGPRSRDVLRRVCGDANAFDGPYLAARETTLLGVPARVLRVGFVGELGYELHVPAGAALGVWEALLQAGRDLEIRPFGVEAQRVLRLEKGHLLVGQDTDALSSPFEVGLGWAVKMGKSSFVSKRSLAIRQGKRAGRKLVGFAIDGDADSLVRECHLVVDEGGIQGRVTSVVRSPALGHTVGLAFVGGAAVAAGSFEIRVDRTRRVPARIVPTPFYDPESSRQHAPASDAPAAHAVSGNAQRVSPFEPLFRALPSFEADVERARVEALGVFDVSRTRRRVVKGPRAADALRAAGVSPPDAFFTPAPLDAWSFVARTGRAEYWLEGAPAIALTAATGVGVHEREDASLLLTGTRLPDLLSELAAIFVDLGTARLHFTDFLKIGGILSVRPSHGVPTVQLLVDPSYALHVGRAISTLAEELGGGFTAISAAHDAGFSPLLD